jgi:hypothetical protein
MSSLVDVDELVQSIFVTDETEMHKDNVDWMSTFDVRERMFLTQSKIESMINDSIALRTTCRPTIQMIEKHLCIILALSTVI